MAAKFGSIIWQAYPIEIKRQNQYDMRYFMIQNAGIVHETFEGDLSTVEMKMCRKYLGISKLDLIKSLNIRGMLHLKDVVEAKNERNVWFAKL